MNIINKIQEDDCIVITPTSYKNAILEELSKIPYLYRVKFLNKNELKKNLFWEYTHDALYEYAKHYDVLIENAHVFLEAMYANLDEEKDASLFSQRKWLEENKYMIYHPLFLERVKGKTAYVYGYDICDLKELLPKLEKYCKVIFLHEEGKFTPSIYKFKTLEQEVVGIAEQIAELITKNIPLNKIYVCNVNNDYKSVISKIFHQFNIPCETKELHSLYEYEITQKFLNILSKDKKMDELNGILASLEEKYPNSDYHDFYENITAILNKYYKKSRSIKEIWDILIYDLKHTYPQKDTVKEAIRFVDFNETFFKEEDYVFILGVNHSEFPKIINDDDYFSDEEKVRLHLPTSIEKNKSLEEKTIRKIESIPHIILSYKKKSPFKEYIPSSLLQAWDVHHIEPQYGYTNKNYNEYLLNSALDNYINFNMKSTNLSNLFGVENVYYQSYDNSFTGINPDSFVGKTSSCNLSYTSMQKFFECPFKFYIENILNVKKPFTLTPSLIVGNLFHTILEKYFKDKTKLDKIIKEELEDIEIEPLAKKEFLSGVYESEIRRLIATMEHQLERSSFVPTYFEEELAFVDDAKIKFKIYGKVDKIMTFEDEENAYIIVIDYKTSTITADASKLVYGLNMQLFLYLYLIRKSEEFKKYTIAGTYISPIIETIPNYTEKKSYEELLWDQSKYSGFSIKNSSIIEKLDHEYKVASYIKGISVKKDGEFSKSENLISMPIMDKLLDIIGENIELVEQEIENANFKIEPKKFMGDKTAFSCEFCKLKDICYVKPKNIKTIKKYKGLEYLEGSEENDTDKTRGCDLDR